MALNKWHLLFLAIYASLIALPNFASGLIDPTQPPKTQKPNTSTPTAPSPRGWTLESTLVAPDRRVAVINGKLVSEGDSVDGARVIEIRKFDVLVKTSSRHLTLQLLPDFIERNP
ncbi:MAG: hypothetical protein HKN42_00105 [Granulosicoccus sp.]|nr:hypothetical protein [Granulosicoccus sp.]